MIKHKVLIKDQTHVKQHTRRTKRKNTFLDFLSNKDFRLVFNQFSWLKENQAWLWIHSPLQWFIRSYGVNF
jgi:Leu/Phe-tRNA-protein transferase